MTMLMQINMDQRHAQLDSMLNDKSSDSEEHWQQVAVCQACLHVTCKPPHLHHASYFGLGSITVHCGSSTHSM